MRKQIKYKHVHKTVLEPVQRNIIMSVLEDPQNGELRLKYLQKDCKVCLKNMPLVI